MKDVVVTDPQNAPAAIRLEDIYFVLFKHKWKILILSLIGVIAGGAMFLLQKPVYESEAKILIRYVQETKSVKPVGPESQIRTPDSFGKNIINSELEILSSLDLSLQVADLIGPEKVLAKYDGSSNRIAAGVIIRKNLSIEVPKESNVIRISCKHRDPELVQVILNHLIDRYQKRHNEIHRGAGILDDFFSQQTDQMRSRLNQTEQKLRELKGKSGVISLDDSKEAYTREMTKIRQDLFEAEAELAQRKAAVTELEKFAPSKSADSANELGMPIETLNEYKRVSAQLSSLVASEGETLAKYTEENPIVQRLREQIKLSENRKKELEQEYPKLVGLGLTAPASGSGKGVDLGIELANVKSLEARVSTLTAQLQKVRNEAAGLSAAESEIIELQRQKEVDETNYRYYSAGLEQARLDGAVGVGNITGIGVAQAPSPPAKAQTKESKLILALMAGGILLGLGLAFLLELVLDQSVKRPSEVETKLRLPLFFTIPALALGQRQAGKRLLPFSSRRALVAGSDAAAEDASTGAEPPALALWNGHSKLRPYFEAMRDNLVNYFETEQMTHKPKIVAVTGCGTSSGISTVASGLAASLSETGDGKILLVNMNGSEAASYSFLKEKPLCGLPEVLATDTRDAAQVQEKLFVASGNGDSGVLHGMVPKRFSHLVPQMKASDYDFIILDLPAVSQTSITPRVAAFADIVLMVVEAEKTSRDLAARAGALLSKANVHVVVNKVRNHVPACLHQEL